MKRLIPAGIILLILSAFVSPAIAAESIQGESNEYQIFTVKSDEKTTKMLELLEGNQNSRIYNVESEEDLIKIAATLSEDFGLGENELLKSIEKTSDKPAGTNFPEKLMTGNMDQCSTIIIVIIIGSDIYIIYID